jgi:hypothetical protein
LVKSDEATIVFLQHHDERRRGDARFILLHLSPRAVFVRRALLREVKALLRARLLETVFDESGGEEAPAEGAQPPPLCAQARAAAEALSLDLDAAEDAFDALDSLLAAVGALGTFRGAGAARRPRTPGTGSPAPARPSSSTPPPARSPRRGPALQTQILRK